MNADEAIWMQTNAYNANEHRWLNIFDNACRWMHMIADEFITMQIIKYECMSIQVSLEAFRLFMMSAHACK